MWISSIVQSRKKLNQEFINEVEFLGNKKISKQIFSRLPYKINSGDKNLNKIILDSKINTIETSRDSRARQLHTELH